MCLFLFLQFLQPENLFLQFVNSKGAPAAPKKFERVTGHFGIVAMTAIKRILSPLRCVTGRISAFNEKHLEAVNYITHFHAYEPHFVT